MTKQIKYTGYIKCDENFKLFEFLSDLDDMVEEWKDYVSEYGFRADKPKKSSKKQNPKDKSKYMKK